MDFDLPAEIIAKLRELDEFIEREIKPLEARNIQFFDHRREYARTNWDKDGQPRDEWNNLIAEMERLADQAGHLRYGLPVETAAGRLPLRWQSRQFASTWRPEVSAYTTTCRTNPRL